MKDNTMLLQTAIERITLLQEQYKSLRDSSLLSDNFEYFEYKRSGVQSSLKILENLLAEQTQPTINGVDDDGCPQGYWEVYWGNGRLYFKGNYVNGKEHGYWEVYYYNGQSDFKGYYDMGKRVDYNPDAQVELTLPEIANKLGIPVEQLRIKK